MKKFLLITLISLCATTLSLAQDNHTTDATAVSSHESSVQDNPAKGKQSTKQTVLLSCDLHCDGCCEKIMKNIAFEKGVKDIVCDLDSKTVTVTFDTRKTNLETLLKAFARINKPAKPISF